MPVHVPKSRRHVCLVLAFQFVAWLLIVVAAISIAILANWYSEQADHPKSISIASYCAGWISLLLNFLLITLAFDGLQRSIQSTASFTSYSVMVILGAVLFVETMQVYFYHTVTRPDHVHNYAGKNKVVCFLSNLIYSYLLRDGTLLGLVALDGSRVRRSHRKDHPHQCLLQVGGIAGALRQSTPHRRRPVRRVWGSN